MQDQQDYIRNIAEIRSMMERSSKFLSLSGWAGIMAGIYALGGAFVAWRVFHFSPPETNYRNANDSTRLGAVLAVAAIVLLLALCTAVYFSYRQAAQRGENIWNPTTRRLLTSMAVPLLAGLIVIFIFLAKGLVGFIAPFTLLFYGLSLYNASKFTYQEVKFLGFTQMALGVLSLYFTSYGLLFWALGFGLVHIVYGVYMHYRYER